jgi:hypothetical protein
VAGISIGSGGSASASGVGRSVSITHGLSIQPDDVILAFVHVNRGQDIVDDNGISAFTEVIDERGGSSNEYAIYTRVAGASEPPSYQWSISRRERWSVEIRVFRNVDTSVIWDVAPSALTQNSSSSGSMATAPSMTISTPGAMGIVAVFADSSSQNFTNASNGYGDGLTADSQAQATYTRTWMAPGATRQTSVDLNNDDWLIHQIALKPAGP